MPESCFRQVVPAIRLIALSELTRGISRDESRFTKEVVSLVEQSE
jgi:hypothetical protein